MAEKFPITIKGFNALETELKRLVSSVRPQITDAIATARAHGDLSENAEYHAAKEQQRQNEGRIALLQHQKAHAEVIDTSKLSGDTVVFGATVEVENLDTEQMRTLSIVGEFEADIDAGKISLRSPIARALIGKGVGDLVEADTPKGSISYELKKISFGN